MTKMGRVGWSVVVSVPSRAATQSSEHHAWRHNQRWLFFWCFLFSRNANDDLYATRFF